MVEPIHIDEKHWTKTFIKNTVKAGSFVFINRAQYFKKRHHSAQNAEIAVCTFKRGISFEYQVNTQNMYGTTSITTSFAGHKNCASLLQVKSIEILKNKQVLHCTPIALGTGFHMKTPFATEEIGVDCVSHETSANRILFVL
jgi:hypothetical protein